jgi:hypothetical protein
VRVATAGVGDEITVTGWKEWCAYPSPRPEEEAAFENPDVLLLRREPPELTPFRSFAFRHQTTLRKVNEVFKATGSAESPWLERTAAADLVNFRL